jgi:hypothetical protein
VKRPQLAVTSTEPRPAGDELVDQVANLADAVDALTRLVESLEHAVRNLPDNLAVALEK